MDTYQIEIIEPRAKKLLDDMADMDLITVQQVDVEKPNGNSGREQTPRSGREAIMSLAGSWNGMSENDFKEYLSEAKRSGGEIFDRDVTL